MLQHLNDTLRQLPHCRASPRDQVHPQVSSVYRGARPTSCRGYHVTRKQKGHPGRADLRYLFPRSLLVELQALLHVLPDGIESVPVMQVETHLLEYAARGTQDPGVPQVCTNVIP